MRSVIARSSTCQGRRTYENPATCDKLSHVLTVGKLIRQRRAEKKLSQQALADLVGVPRTYLSLWERDKVNPTKPEYLEALAKHLGGDPADYTAKRRAEEHHDALAVELGELGEAIAAIRQGMRDRAELIDTLDARIAQIEAALRRAGLL